jgi:hypothetical protein
LSLKDALLLWERDMTDDELARLAAGGGEPAEQPPLDPKKVN